MFWKIVCQESISSDAETLRPVRQLRPLRSQATWTPSNTAQSEVCTFLEQLRGQDEAEYIHAVRGLDAAFPDGLDHWSLCTGSGTMTHFLQAILAVFEGRFNVKIALRLRLIVEMDSRKRRHAKDEFQPEHTVEKLEHVTEFAMLPPGNFLETGIPCVSRSPYNTAKVGGHQDMVNCVQDNRGMTGQAFSAIECIIDRTPSIRMLSFECVKGLMKKTADKESDADYICDLMRSKGWWMINELLDGIQWGSPEVERMRVWWAGAKGLVGEHDEITAFFRRWQYGM